MWVTFFNPSSACRLLGGVIFFPEIWSAHSWPVCQTHMSEETGHRLQFEAGRPPWDWRWDRPKNVFHTSPEPFWAESPELAAVREKGCFLALDQREKSSLKKTARLGPKFKRIYTKLACPWLNQQPNSLVRFVQRGPTGAMPSQRSGSAG